MEIEDGIIKPGSPAGDFLGLTKERFSGDSYLWKSGKYVWVSNIESKIKGVGYLRNLFETIEANKYQIVVPTPMRRMQEILEKNGFGPFRDSHTGCEVWLREE